MPCRKPGLCRTITLVGTGRNATQRFRFPLARQKPALRGARSADRSAVPAVLPCKHRANTSAIHNDPRCQIDEAIQNGTNHLAHHDTTCHTAVRVQIPATVRKPGEFVHSFPCVEFIAESTWREQACDALAVCYREVGL